MFLTESFDTQLDDLLDRACAALELSPTQHQTAEARYRAIGQWLSAPGTVLARFRPEIYPQGSLRIGTTVRPFARLEYDLDLVCELVGLDWQQVRNPIAVLNTAEQRLREHDTYKHMLERKNRCIRVNYANEFHLDVLPGCPHPGDGTDRILVPDRKAQAWTASNPKGYADWFEARCALGEAVIKAIQPLPAQEPADMKATLKRIVQLLKRWRDLRYRHDPANAPISIVLTTLAGTYLLGRGVYQPGSRQRPRRHRREHPAKRPSLARPEPRQCAGGPERALGPRAGRVCGVRERHRGVASGVAGGPAHARHRPGCSCPVWALWRGAYQGGRRRSGASRPDAPRTPDLRNPQIVGSTHRDRRQ